MSKYGSRNLLFWYLWARFLKIMLYLKLPLSNLSKFKILAKEKQKFLNLGPKLPYFGIFWLDFQKNLCFDF